MLVDRSRDIVVTGATSAIGSLLVPLLLRRGLAVRTLGRNRTACALPVPWDFLDLTDLTLELPEPMADTLIHVAGIWLLPGWLEKFHMCGVRRVIAFSSTSRFTKQESASGYERGMVEKIIAAEESLIAECQRLGIVWTIFRPTLIYGGPGGDRNVSDIARFVRKLGFFPVFGAARGRRQPVNAHDLAAACLQCLDSMATHNRAYNLSGGEILPYVDMVRRIFETLGQRPVFLRIPISVFRLAVRVANFHPRYAHLTPDMAARMEDDLVFDHGDAKRDFGYCPGKFDPAYLLYPVSETKDLQR